MFVKICGITRLEDAQAAIACGASAIGFVFWPGSPRFVDPYRAREIASRVPPFVSTVGVFVDQPEADVNGIASVARLAVVQLHGNESPAYASRLSRPVLKAISVVEAETDRSWPAHVRLLVDAHDPVKRGGTGARADWTAAAALARTRPIVLAGGLEPNTVGDALAAVQPFGIDVSSGVESAPGVKDRRKLEALFSAIEKIGTGTSWRP